MQAETFLRLLRRRLRRQLSLLREERIPEALEMEAALADMSPQLATLSFAGEPQIDKLQALRAQCAALTDSIQPYLDRERGLLNREWVELQVEQELSRLARESDLPPNTSRQSSLR